MKKYIYLQFLLVALSLAALLYVAFQERVYVEVPVRMELNEPDSAAGTDSASEGVVQPRVNGGTLRAVDGDETSGELPPEISAEPETAYQVVPTDRAAPEGAGSFRAAAPESGEVSGGEQDGEETIYQ